MDYITTSNCLWNKIKSIITKHNANSKDNEMIFYIISSIGKDIISTNQFICREYDIWIDLYNSYIGKLDSFNNFIQTKEYTAALNNLNISIDKIRQKVNNLRLKNDNKLFFKALKEVIAKNSYYSDILNNLENEFFLNHLSLSHINKNDIDLYSPKDINELVVDILNNSFQSVKLLLEKENTHKAKVIDHIKDSLDKLTDVMENDTLLSVDRINELSNYLETQNHFLSNLIK